MNRFKIITENLRSIVTQDYAARRQHEDKRADELAVRQEAAEARLAALGDELRQGLTSLQERLEKRADDFERAVSTRLDNYESAVDARIEERFTSIESTLEARLNTVESRMDIVERRLDERLDEITDRVNERMNNYEAAVDERLESRMDNYEASVDERFEEYTIATDERFATYTRAVDARADERLEQIERRSDERTAQHAAEVDRRFAQLKDDFTERFDQRARALDTRTDDRLMNLERAIEQRLTNYERGVDERLTKRERFVDGVLESMRKDLVARTDILLQAIEQRQDRLRTMLKSAALGAPQHAMVKPSELLPAMPKFSEIAPQPPSHNGGAQKTGGESLLDRIVEWKKHSAEKLHEFTPDEQEIVDYILSFITDPNDEAYVRLHLRRFVATLQRVPPAQRTSARALELGSYVQFTPALKKYAGYGEVKCADLWEGGEKVERVQLVQRGGGESHTFELHNFDAEREPFPYPDKHFQLVLCCEMIEHLAHDPMHMLWEANRVLEESGYLLLTTPNITSARAIEGLLTGYAPYLMSQYNVEYPPGQHHREYAPREIRLALEAAGFTVLELETEDVWLRSNPAILELLERLGMSTEMRGDNIFALARKTSMPVERYPKELYVSEGEKTPA